MNRPSRATFVGVFLLASSIILLQIALTRVLAVMMWHHLTYVIISLALLGFGASGSILTARRAKGKDASAIDSMTWFAALYGVSIIASFALVGRVEVDSLNLWANKTNLLKMLALFVITAVPFLLGGMALGLALTRFSTYVDRVYFVDLVGSGIGGAASVPLLMSIGASSTLAFAAVIALVSAGCFAVAAGRGARLGSVPLIGLGLAGCLAFSGVGPTVGLPQWHWEPSFAPGKMMSGFAPGEVDRIYSATAEVEVAPSRDDAVAIIGGDIGASAMETIGARLVGQDGDAPTMLIEGAGDLDRFTFLANTQTASAHVAFDARGGIDPKVLVIGVGGGIDVMISLLRGASSVTAVEINSAMIEMVTERYDDYIGGLFRPGTSSRSDAIRLVHGEGRSFVSSTDERFDLIQMSGVDSVAALSTGAYTLSESYLYTVEAVQTFYARLEDDGYINYSRAMQAPPARPRETLRLANIAFTALEELGIEDPGAHIAVFLGRAWASTMIKRGPFTAAEVEALDAYAAQEGFGGLVFDPMDRDHRGTRHAVERSGAMNLADAALDRLLRTHVPGIDEAALPAAREAVRRAHPVVFGDDRGAAERELDRLAAEFSAEQLEATKLGFGHVVLEMQRVQTAMRNDLPELRSIFGAALSRDARARAAFIDAYENDISPCTDDRAFFFNYYRYGPLLRRLLGMATDDERRSGFPVGHLVLLASIAQITLLAALMIFWPLRRLARAGQRVAGTWRYFSYFAALGMGFMFVEIVLMQKLVVFLGHPTYSIAVVLSSLLVFAGVGSLLSGRIVALSRGGVLAVTAAVVVALVGLCWFVNSAAPAMLGLPLGMRFAIAVAVLLPVGIALGMPFPTGMRLVSRDCPQLLPWCWAVNGFLSVFAAMFCILLAMQVGFTAVLLGAIGVYAVGLSLIPMRRITPA